MHAIAARVVRPAARYPARFVAGRRHCRRFHPASPSCLPRRPNPYEQVDDSLKAELEKPEPPRERVEQNESGIERSDESSKGAKNSKEVAQGGSGSHDESSRRIAEALYARAERHDRQQARQLRPPEVKIPKWFQSRNVKLAEETLESKPRASYACTLNVRSKEDNSVLATISVPSTHGDAVRTFESVSSKLRDHSTKSDGDGALDERSNTIKKEFEHIQNGTLPKDIGYSPDFWVEAEIKARIAGSLSAAQPADHLSFPASRSNIVLHTPVQGGIGFLSDLVKDIATSVGADVVQLDAQDLAELGSDYIQEPDPGLHSIRTLGFDTHQSPHAASTEDMWDENPEYEEEQSEATPPATFSSPIIAIEDLRPSKGAQSPSTFMAALPHLHGLLGRLQNHRDRLSGMLKDGSQQLDSSNGLPEILTPRDARRRDIHLAYLLAALSNSNELKRANQTPGPRKAKAKGPDFFNDSSPSEVREFAADRPITLLSQTEEKTIADLKMSSARDASASYISELPSRKTIILIQDFKEMMNVASGRWALNKLADIVKERRKNGDNVMIVGVTSATDMTPILNVEGIRQLQNESDDATFRTILVPGPTAVTPLGTNSKILSKSPQAQQVTTTGDAAQSQMDNYAATAAAVDEEGLGFTALGSDVIVNDTWSMADGARTGDINQRHICDMIRRIDPSVRDVADKLRTERLSQYLSHFNELALARRPLSHEEVHHLCMISLGLRPSKVVTVEVLAHQINLAMGIIRLSDASKYGWCHVQRLWERQERDAEFDQTPEQAPTDKRLAKLKKECNDHEKKLLGGVIDRNSIRTTFDDVHATPESIEALKTLTTLSLLRPDAFKYGVLATDKIPGLLLYGPPGTGKTLLAKAVARDSGATMLEVSGSEINDMYVGEGEKNVKAVFTLARKLTPCVVFIDEADALFRSRSGPGARTAHREVINQFLREWDGMDDLGVFIMVATNRPFDLDDAVLRRLPRRLLVDLPTEKDRHAILNIHLKEEGLAADVSTSELAARTPFYSGSDLKNMCVAAALACVREENEVAKAADGEKGEYTYPEKRTLHPRHFDKALVEISASISEDMATLSAIKKFDEQYGDKRGRRKKSGYGFTPAALEAPQEELARVRI